MKTKLTKREQEVWQVLAWGCTNKEIAFRLGIAEHTVEQHLKALYVKLEVRNRAEATRCYWQTAGRQAQLPAPTVAAQGQED